MKLVYTLLFGLLCSGTAVAQKTEVAVQLNTSASYFAGNSADKSTYISVSDTWPGERFLGEAYGKSIGIGYGIGLQVQRVTSYSMLLGVQVSAEQLRSKIKIDRIIGFRQETAADGDATLRLNAVNVQPYVGWRIASDFADIDLSVGTDVGYIYKSKFNGEATDVNNDTFEVSGEGSEPELDLRPRVGVAAYRGHFGFSLSYAHGLINYRGDWDGGNGELYSRVFRLGLLYRL